MLLIVLVTRLQQSSARETAPQVGQPLPPFHPPDEGGHIVSLEQRPCCRHVPPRALVSLLPFKYQRLGAGAERSGARR